MAGSIQAVGLRSVGCEGRRMNKDNRLFANFCSGGNERAPEKMVCLAIFILPKALA